MCVHACGSQGTAPQGVLKGCALFKKLKENVLRSGLFLVCLELTWEPGWLVSPKTPPPPLSVSPQFFDYELFHDGVLFSLYVSVEILLVVDQHTDVSILNTCTKPLESCVPF